MIHVVRVNPVPIGYVSEKCSAKFVLGVACLLLACCACSLALELDIHVEIGSDQLFRGISRQLQPMLPNNQIDFRTTALPHVTLYLTEFVNRTIPRAISMYDMALKQPVPATGNTN